MATAAASHRLASLLRSNLVRAAVQPRGSHVAIHETRSRCMKWNSSFAPRHGKAVEPVIIEETTQEEKAQPKDKTQSEDSLRPEDKTKLENKTRAPGEQEQEQPTSTKHNAEASRTKSIVKCENQGPAEEAHENEPSRKTSDDSADESTGASSSSTRPLDEPTQQIKDKAKANGPLEAIMHMQPPQKAKGQHPHMSPSPYVHHFDSYTLVKHLQDGGYTQNQAIEAMKGIRALLAQNLDVAQESLVSKSDVENETYLFSAACSELGQEIKNNRRLQDEQERQQRTHLQHEVDILTQSLNQEVLTLNDNVRGMFNDRRMTVREEQKNADSSVSASPSMPFLEYFAILITANRSSK